MVSVRLTTAARSLRGTRSRYPPTAEPTSPSWWPTRVSEQHLYKHTGIEPSTTLHYRVSAINSAGTGPPSEVRSATTEASSNPDAPTGLNASANGRTQIDLRWTAPTDNGGAEITGYKIEVSTDGGANFTDVVADTGNAELTYSHTGLPSGQTRHYRVSAINSVGTGPESNVAHATTDPGAPDAPTNLVVTALARHEMLLEWDAPTHNGGADITGYKIEVSEDGGENFADLVADTGNSFSLSASHEVGRADKTLHYRVSAINSIGTGPPSGVAHATTVAPLSPGPPSDLDAVAHSTQIQLSWSLPYDGGTDITGYKVEVSTDGGTSFADLVADTGNADRTYRHTGLQSGETRHYRVSTINSVGTSAPSSVASATVLFPTLISNISPDSEISWLTAFSDLAQSFTTGGHGAGYNVRSVEIELSSVSEVVRHPPRLRLYSGSADGTLVASFTRPAVYRTSGINEYTPSSPLTLTEDTTYWLVADGGGANWSVSDTGSVQESASGWSIGERGEYRNRGSSGNFFAIDPPLPFMIRVFGEANPLTAPGAPTGLNATANGPTQIDLQWVAPNNDGGAEITGYKIEASTDDGVNFTDLVADTGNADLTYSHTGLQSGQTRHYRVSAINSVGTGPESNIANATTATPTAPAFADANDDGTADPVSLTVAENAAGETAVGTVAATDADGDTLAHSVGGADASDFNGVFALDAATGAVTVKAGASPDFEAKDSYAVTISVTDGEDDAGNAEATPTADDTVEVTVSVTDLEEAGSVSLSTASPQVNAEVTATVSDPDGSVSDVSWRWRKSATETGSFEDGATGASYTPGGGGRGRLAAGRRRLHRPAGIGQDGGEPGPAGRVRAAHGAGLRRRQRGTRCPLRWPRTPPARRRWAPWRPPTPRTSPGPPGRPTRPAPPTRTLGCGPRPATPTAGAAARRPRAPARQVGATRTRCPLRCPRTTEVGTVAATDARRRHPRPLGGGADASDFTRPKPPTRSVTDGEPRATPRERTRRSRHAQRRTGWADPTPRRRRRGRLAVGSAPPTAPAFAERRSDPVSLAVATGRRRHPTHSVGGG